MNAFKLKMAFVLCLSFCAYVVIVIQFVQFHFTPFPSFIRRYACIVNVIFYIASGYSSFSTHSSAHSHRVSYLVRKIAVQTLYIEKPMQLNDSLYSFIDDDNDDDDVDRNCKAQ